MNSFFFTFVKILPQFLLPLLMFLLRSSFTSPVNSVNGTISGMTVAPELLSIVNDSEFGNISPETTTLSTLTTIITSTTTSATKGINNNSLPPVTVGVTPQPSPQTQSSTVRQSSLLPQTTPVTLPSSGSHSPLSQNLSSETNAKPSNSSFGSSGGSGLVTRSVTTTNWSISPVSSTTRTLPFFLPLPIYTSYTISDVFNDFRAVLVDASILYFDVPYTVLENTQPTGQSQPPISITTVQSQATTVSARTVPTTPPPPPPVDPSYTWTGVLIVAAAVVCLLQIYVSVLGRRMCLEAIRWYTIGYNAWNLILLILVADQHPRSPWLNFLDQQNMAATYEQYLSLLVLSIFPFAIILLLPVVALEYSFASKIRRSKHYHALNPLSFSLFFILPAIAFWIVASINLSPTTSNQQNATQSVTMSPLPTGGIPVYHPTVLEHFAFWTVNLAWIWTVLFAIGVLLVIFVLGLVRIYRSLAKLVKKNIKRGVKVENSATLPNSKRNNGEEHGRNNQGNTLAWLLLDAVLLVILLCAGLITLLPPFMVMLQSYGMLVVWPTIKSWITQSHTYKQATNSTGITVTPVQVPLPSNIESQIYMDALLRMENIQGWMANANYSFQLAMPFVEFLATALLVRAYREQYLHLLSCGNFYAGERHGSSWHLFRWLHRKTRNGVVSPAVANTKNLFRRLMPSKSSKSRKFSVIPEVETAGAVPNPIIVAGEGVGAEHFVEERVLDESFPLEASEAEANDSRHDANNIGFSHKNRFKVAFHGTNSDVETGRNGKESGIPKLEIGHFELTPRQSTMVLVGSGRREKAPGKQQNASNADLAGSGSFRRMPPIG